ncbi:MAG: 2'-5' RNA ligase family protein [Alphaproteobacteria bacterium]|nr:2'-5' RNA ligase family protein [Alphaproteobacteria bacterium]
MAYAITVGLDEAGSEGLWRLRRALTAAGIPDVRTGLGFRANLTLAVYEDLDVETACRELSNIAAQMPMLPALFAGFALFPGRSANLWAAPSPDPRLLVMQRAVRAAVAGRIWELYRPEVWVPHCTLATGLSPEEIATASRVLAEAWQPFEGVFVRLTLASFPPVEELWQQGFQNG